MDADSRAEMIASVQRAYAESWHCAYPGCTHPLLRVDAKTGSRDFASRVVGYHNEGTGDSPVAVPLCETHWRDLMAGKIPAKDALLEEWGAAQRAAASAIGGGWPVSKTEAHSVLQASDPAHPHIGDDHYNATLTGVLGVNLSLQEWLGLVPIVGAIGFVSGYFLLDTTYRELGTSPAELGLTPIDAVIVGLPLTLAVTAITLVVFSIFLPGILNTYTARLDRAPSAIAWRVIRVVVVAMLIFFASSLFVPDKLQPLVWALVFPLMVALFAAEWWAWVFKTDSSKPPLFKPRSFVALVLILGVAGTVLQANEDLSSDATFHIRTGHWTEIGWVAPFVRTASPVLVDETTRTTGGTPEPTDAEACYVLLGTNAGYSIMWNVRAERTEAIPSGENRLIAVSEC